MLNHYWQFYSLSLDKFNIIRCIQVLLDHLDKERGLGAVGEIRPSAVGDHAEQADEFHKVEQNPFHRRVHFRQQQSTDNPKGVPVVDFLQHRNIDYLLKTRRIRLSNVSRLLKSAPSGEEK